MCEMPMIFVQNHRHRIGIHFSGFGSRVRTGVVANHLGLELKAGNHSVKPILSYLMGGYEAKLGLSTPVCRPDIRIRR